ncbi:hypothetical protein FD754_013170 [Muntiacus muntjak]|uniref:Leptin receptor gene-related protein n=1 Tax=Muntiacus muntjak TaxID=9888 RepID=A0A5N3VH25_MUNMU|nr:hypothetical protein FD754_013170 [Muntiacus muntjak]
MAGVKALVALSVSGAIGLTFLMLGCALEDYATYDSDATSIACRELAYFFTTGIVAPAFGFPVIPGGLVLVGNAVIFLTIQGFFLVFGRGDDFSWEQR